MLCTLLACVLQITEVLDGKLPWEGGQPGASHKAAVRHARCQQARAEEEIMLVQKEMDALLAALEARAHAIMVRVGELDNVAPSFAGAAQSSGEAAILRSIHMGVIAMKRRAASLFDAAKRVDGLDLGGEQVPMEGADSNDDLLDCLEDNLPEELLEGTDL